MQSRIVFSDSTPLTEYEFFRREFGLELTYCKPKDFGLMNFDASTSVLIASTSPQAWEDQIRRLPKSSVVFFLLGNETYETSIFNSLNGIASIKHVFIYNAPTQIRKSNHWYSLIGDFIDQVPHLGLNEIKGILRDNRTSWHLGSKFKATNLDYSWSRLPQGYSNSFVSGLKAINELSPDKPTSLIDLEYVSKFQNGQKKNRTFLFVGQRTNRRRSQVVRYFENRKDSIMITKNSGFGGNIYDGDSTYVKFLLSSWFNVIPPGYFNNANHRYTESCIVGSIPVILFQNSIDHSENQNWTSSLTKIQAHSIKGIVWHLQNLDEIGLLQLANQIQARDFESILQTRRMINEILK